MVCEDDGRPAGDSTIHTHFQHFQCSPQATLLHPRATLEWRQCTNLPVGMYDAQAVVLNDKVYIGGGSITIEATLAASVTTAPNIYTYDPTTDTWVFEEGEQTWGQPLPPMPTGRWRASAVSYRDYLIVAGGYNYSGYLNTVEVFHGQQWVTADPLPERSCSMKSNSHDGHYYLMGVDCQGTSVFYTSIQSLVEKATQHPPTSPSNTDQPP